MLQEGVCLRQLFFGGDDFAVANLGRPAQVALALGPFRLDLEVLDPALEFADAADEPLLVRPAGTQASGLVLQIGDMLSDLLQPLGAFLVLFLFERALLDLVAKQGALLFIDLLGQAVDFKPEGARRLVDQIDGLVRKLAITDVAVRKRGRRHDGAVEDTNTVVDLVALLEPAQDGNRILDARLADEDGLKAPLQGGVLFDVLAVLVERGRADAVKLAPREGGLENVRGVYRPLGGPRADDGMQLVDEENDLALGLAHLLEHRLEAVLELAPVLRSRDKGADIEREQALVLESLGDITADDAKGEALGDGRLSDAGLPDEHGIILRAAGDDLHDAANLHIPADDRVELSGAGPIGQVDGEPLERLVAALEVGVGDALGAANFLERLEHLLAGETHLGEKEGHVLLPAFEPGEDKVLPAHEFIRKGFSLGLRVFDKTLELGGDIHLPSRYPRELIEDKIERLVQGIGINVRLAHERGDNAAGLLQKGEQHMGGH